MMVFRYLCYADPAAAAERFAEALRAKDELVRHLDQRLAESQDRTYNYERRYPHMSLIAGSVAVLQAHAAMMHAKVWVCCVAMQV